MDHNPTLHGEVTLYTEKNVTYFPPCSEKSYVGFFQCTNYQIDHTMEGSRVCVSFPLADIVQIDFAEISRAETRVTFWFRDVRHEVFHLRNESIKNFQKIVKKFTYKSASDLFAYKHPYVSPSGNKKDKVDELWNLYSIESEFQRLGSSVSLGSSGNLGNVGKEWVLKSVNDTYDLCRVYPRLFYGPAGVKDTDLWRVAIYRGESRIPILTWRGKNVALMRGARPNPMLLQDMVGMTPVRNESDLRLVNELYRSSGSPRMVIVTISDTEDKINPNLAISVLDETYPDCTMEYFNVASPAVVTQYYLAIQRTCTIDFQGLSEVKQRVLDSGWVDSVEMLLHIAMVIADHIVMDRVSVLLQSRDGDDLCAQISCLSQLLIDPYYRTMRGFATLIEKEWVYNGHHFPEVGMKGANKGQDVAYYAATWVQFLDAVWQLTRAFPRAFQFNEAYLIFLAESCTSGRFGTFLYPNDKSRRSSKVMSQTRTVWSHLLAEENKGTFASPWFDEAGTARTLIERVGGGFWASYFFRHTIDSKLSDFSIGFNEEFTRVTKSDKIEKLSFPKKGISILPPIKNPSAFRSVTSVTLSENHLTQIPLPLLQLCESLKELDLSDNFISSLSQEVLDLLDPLPLRVFKMSNNRLQFLPKSLKALKKLRELRMSHNRLKVIGDLLSLQESLHILDFSYNELEEIPKLGKLTRLKEIYLSHNRLQFIENVGDLSKLTTFELFFNELRAVPEGISRLDDLDNFDISENPLEKLEEIWNKNELVTLRLNNTGLRTFPAALPYDLAESLTVISLQYNKLTSFPTGLLMCTSLVVLFLNNNFLENIPFEICRLVSLRRLAISHNKLTTVTSGISKLPLLENLEMQNNRIEEIPIAFSALKLRTFKFEGNPIRNLPEEIRESGDLRSIMAYLSALSKESCRLYRMKFMIVGQENVGKTALLNCLMRTGDKSVKSSKKDKNSALKTVSTDGIDIHTYNFKCPVNENGKPDPNGKDTVTVALSAWDFGGQEIYYTTHQFFLSHRSVFVVVWNIALDEEFSRVEYWMQSILARAKGCKIILVGTHVDEVSSDHAAKVVKQMTDKYLNRIPGLVNPILSVSCATGEGIEKFTFLLQNVCLNERTMGELLPHCYLRLESEIKCEAIAKEKDCLVPVMEWQDFKALAQTCDIVDEKHLNMAVVLLHNLGSLIHFRGDELLSEIVILNPVWLTKLMCTLITTKHHYVKDGKIKHTAFHQIWRAPEFPETLHIRMFRILEKFEVLHCLDPVPMEMTSDDTFYEKESLVPSLLPEDPPKANFMEDEVMASTEKYGRFYRFPFLPHGLFPRLTNRLFSLTRNIEAWREGVVMGCGANGRVIVTLVPQGPKRPFCSVEILAVGLSQKLFQMTIETLDSLIDGWYDLNPAIEVACGVCLSRCGVSQHLYKLEECELAVVKGQTSITCPVHSIEVPLEILVPDILMVSAEYFKVEHSSLVRDRKIGEGGYADVYRGVYSEKSVAIKILRFKESEEEGKESGVTPLEAFSEFRREVWIMSSLSHPCLCGLVGFCIYPPCIVCEFVDKGDLYSFVHRTKDDPKYEEISVSLRLRMALDIALGMRYLHTRDPPIIHRDLKTPNVLLGSVDPAAEVVCKIADFGLSQVMLAPTAGRKVANPVWLAPEVMKNLPYGDKSDVYSYGVMLWELVSRADFFGDVSFMSRIEEKVLDGERPPIPSHCEQEYKNLIQISWDSKPNKRPSFHAVVQRLRTYISSRSSDFPELVKFIQPEPVDEEIRAKRFGKKLLIQLDGKEFEEGSSKDGRSVSPLRKMAGSAAIQQGYRSRMMRSFTQKEIYKKSGREREIIGVGGVGRGRGEDDYLKCFEHLSGDSSSSSSSSARSSLSSPSLSSPSPSYSPAQPSMKSSPKKPSSTPTYPPSASPSSSSVISPKRSFGDSLVSSSAPFYDMEFALEAPAIAADLRKSDRRKLMASMALNEDLVGPISSHITPIRVIEGNEMPGAIRTLCAVDLDGLVWVGCESGKIIRFVGESGDAVDVLNAHTDCIMTITVGMGYVWTSDVTGAMKVWSLTGGKMKVKKDISTDKMSTRCAFTVLMHVSISSSAGMWAAAADTILLFDSKLQWVKKKRLVLDKEKIAVLCMVLHNSKVWLGTNQGVVTINPDDMAVMNYFPEKVGEVTDMTAVGADLWTCCSDGFIRIWDGETGKCLRFIGGESGIPYSLTRMQACMWCLLSNGSIVVWDAKSLLVLGIVGSSIVPEKHPLMGGMMLIKGVVWASRGTKVMLWNSETVNDSLHRL